MRSASKLPGFGQMPFPWYLKVALLALLFVSGITKNSYGVATVTLTSTVTQSYSVCPSGTNRVLYNFKLASAGGSATLSSITVKTGTVTPVYTASDIVNFKLWKGGSVASGVLSGATQVGSSVTTIPSAGSNILFSGLSDVIASGGNTIYWVTADVQTYSSVTNGHIISIQQMTNASYTLSSGSQGAAGGGAAGGSQKMDKPAITATASPNPICVGNTLSLSSTPSGGSGSYTTYSWNGPGSYTAASQNPTRSGTTTGYAGVYSVTVTDNIGCTSSTAVTSSVTVNPLPPVITGTTNICTGITTTLTDSTSGGTWASSNTSSATIGSSSGVVGGVATGSSVISYTLSTGCRITTTVAVSGNPTITSVSPSLGDIGSTVTITGANFNTTTANDIVFFGATQATVSSATNTMLVVTIPTGATYMPISVDNAVCALTAFSPKPFLPTFDNSAYVSGIVNFDTTTTFTTGTPVGIATGDIDGDGKADIVVANYSYNTISVFRNTGSSGMINSASFAAAVTFSTTGTPYTVAIGDLNMDGKPDIVVANHSGSSVSVFRNTSTLGSITTSSLAAKVDFTTDLSPWGVAIADMDGDGLPDILAQGNQLSILRNTTTSAPSLSFATKVSFNTGEGPGNLAIADIDGDGKPDVIGYDYNADSILVLRNTATPGSITSTSLGGRVCFATGHNPTSVTTADIDGDGKQDIVVTNSAATGGAASISVFRNTAASGSVTSSSLAARVDLFVSSSPYRIAAGDMDGDGKPDIIYSNDWIQSVSVFRNNATAGSITSSSFASAISYTGMPMVTYLAIDDMDGDGKPDIIAGKNTGTITVLRNDPLSPITGSNNVCEGLTITMGDSTNQGAWISSDTTVAVINATSGVLTGVSAGTAVISYTVTGGSATKTVTVNPLAAITGTTEVCTGSTTTLSNTNSGGTWTSSITSVATVGSATGIVRGATTGTTIITYTLSTGCRASVVVTVDPMPAAITGTTTFCALSTTTLGDVTPAGTWASSNTAVATAGTTGVVYGLSAGTVTITYLISTGCLATKQVTVNAATAITGTAGLCTGTTATLANSGGAGTWSSINTFVATVGTGTGIVSGVNAGTSIITYNYSTGCKSTVVVTVSQTPSVISGTATVCEGAYTTLTNSYVTTSSWSSSNTSVATVFSGGAAGDVTGVSGGTATISYTTAAGCYATRQVTVYPITPISGSHGTCIGNSTTLTSGPSGGTWSSGNPSIATVSSSGVVFGVATGFTVITYTMSTGCRATYNLSVSSLSISGLSGLCKGNGIILGNSSGLSGAWSSSNTAVATVSSPGSGTTVSGVSFGTATITYSVSGCAVTKQIQVDTLTSVSGPTSVCTGTTSTFTASTTGGAWSSSNTSVATIGSTGVLMGVAVGTTTISYTLSSGCMKTVTVSVGHLAVITGPSSVCTSSPVTLADTLTGGTWSATGTVISIGSASGIVSGLTAGTAMVTYTYTAGCFTTRTMTVITGPSAITGTLSVCSGRTTTLTEVVSGGTWSSSNTAVATAAAGVVSGVAAGTTNISYITSNGCYAIVVVTVNQSPAAISGSSAVCASSAIILTDSSTGGTWSPTSAGIATVGSSSGIVSAFSSGTFTVTYTLANGCFVTKSVTINDAPVAITGTMSVCTGLSTTLYEYYLGGTWSSSNAAIATVVSGGMSGILTTGIVGGNTTGTANISYTLANGCYAFATVTVNQSPAAITGSSAICASSSALFTDTTAGGTWSAFSGIISVSSAGLASASAPGSATVTYTISNGCNATKAVTINASPNPLSGTTAVCTGRTTTLSESTSGGTWSSANTAIATVGTGGVVTGVAAGAAVISYTIFNGCAATATVTVSQSPAAIAGASVVCASSTTTLTDITAGGTWSTFGGMMSVGSTTGLVSAFSPGSATVTYTISNGCYAVQSITINSTPSTIFGTLTICSGRTTSLTDPSTGGAWSSSNTAAATVGTSGTVTGVSAGTSIISYTFAATGCAATATMTVSQSPGAMTGVSTICAVSSATFADTTLGGTWSAFSSIISVGSTTGLVTAFSPGSATVTYAISNGCYALQSVTVNSIPSAIFGTATVCSGRTTSLSDGSTGGIWSSANTTVATVGTSGTVTGVSAGTSVISYTFAATGCAATATTTVNQSPGAMTGVSTMCAVSSATFTDTTLGGTWSAFSSIISVGSTTGLVTAASPGSATVTYTISNGCMATKPVTVNSTPSTILGTVTVCTGRTTSLSDGSTGGIWSSANTTVATVGTSGIVTGVSAGTSIISYTFAATGCAAAATTTVNQSPAAIAGASVVCASSTTTLTDITAGGTWSTFGGIMSVGSTTGLVSAFSPGSATVTYTVSNGCYALQSITVNSTPSTIFGTTRLCSGLTIPLSEGSTGGTWSSANTAVATVGTSGIVTGVSAGTSAISYTFGTGCAASVTVTVNQSPAAITGATAVCLGSATTLADVTTGGSWSSSSLNASIDSVTGIVTGASTGTAIISYSIATGCIATRNFTVNLLPSAITGASNVCAGSYTTLSDTITGGTWTCGSTTIATIGSATGIVMGIARGTTTITYTLSTACSTTSAMAVAGPPAVTSLSASVGYPLASVTITGFNFNSMPANDIVYFGATKATVTTATATSLDVSVPYGATYMPVSVNSTDCPLTGFSQYPFLPTFDNTGYVAGVVNFDNKVSFATGSAPNRVVIGDLDGDGKPDLVVINRSANTVSVYQNTSVPGSIGSGSFAAKVDFATGSLPNAVAIADMDGDGRPDIIVGNSGSVSVLRHTASGGSISTSSFAAKVDFTGSAASYSLAIGDIDGDGRPDIAVTNSNSNFFVLRNTAVRDTINSSSFAAFVSFPTGNHSLGIAMGDIDGDGKPDIAVTNNGDNSVSVYRNTATIGSITSSSFSAKSDIATGTAPNAVAIGDLDGDGKPELVVANISSSTVSVYRNIAVSGSVTSSSFTAKTDYTSPSSPFGVAIADMDGDGKPDVAVAGNSGGSVSVLRNTGSALAAKVDFLSGTVASLSIGDLDGDGRPDIVATRTGGDSIVIFRNNPLLPVTGASVVCQGAATSLGDATTGGTWISSSTGIATVGSSSGTVTGVSAGTVTISYKVNGGSATLTLTVNPILPVTGTASVCAGSTTTLNDATGGGDWNSSNTAIATVGTSTGIVSGVTAGSALITYTTATGCMAVKTVTVNPLPASVTGTANVCAGSATTLSDPDAGGTWSSSNTGIATIGSVSGIVNGITAGTSAITYSLATGCRTTAVLTVNPLPASITGIAAACEGASTTLSNVVAGGTWSSGNTSVASIGSGTGFVNGVTAGTAMITYILATGCLATRVLTINALPAGISGAGAICQGATTALTSTPAGGTWSSDNVTVATIGSGTGMITGIASGTANITYTLSTGCLSAATVLVNPLPSAITGTTNVCSGSTTTLSNSTTGGTWSSSNTVRAIIGSATGVVSGITAGTTIITYMLVTGCIATVSAQINPLPASITGSTTLCEGASATLSSATAGGTWSSSDMAVATAGSTTGLVGGVATGAANITYTLPTGCTVGTTMTVVSSPSAITGATNICAGTTDTLNNAITGGLWSSSNTARAAVGSVTGVVTGISAGTSVITYSLGTGCITTTSVQVNTSPSAITGATTICQGASATLNSGTAGGSWSSSDVSIATVGSGSGIVTGVVQGTVTLTYTLATGCMATKTMTINPLPSAIAGITNVCTGSTTTLSDPDAGGAWSSSNTFVVVGSTTGIVSGITAGTSIVTYNLGGGCISTTSVQINATPASISGTGALCEGVSATLTSATTGGVWSSSDISIATAGSGSGIITGVLHGTVTVTYTLPAGCLTVKTMTINPLPSVITGATNVCAGSIATLSNSYGGGIWSSNNSIVATMGSATGTLTGVAAGTAVISYSLATGCRSTATVTVNTLPSTITGTSTVCVGLTTTLSDVTTGGTWSSGNTFVATVGSGSGIVAGISAGTAVISYSLATGCIVVKIATVNPLPSAITGAATVCAGAATTLGNSLPGGTWSSSNTAVTTIVSGTGVINGVSSGTATVTYRLATGCLTTAAMTVNSVAAISGTTIVGVGSTVTLSDATTGGAWSSSNSLVATIGTGTGIVSGVASGTAVITYTPGTGCVAMVTVNVITISSGITGSTTFCVGGTSPLNYTTTGGTWSSSNSAVATVGAISGIVTGVAPGTATITYTTGTVTATTVVIVNASSGAPTITSLNVYMGMPSSSVTISGTNFNTIPAGNIVYFGATQATVSAATSTSLSVIVPASATYMPVSVDNTGCGLIAYSQYPFQPDFDNTAYVAGTVNFTAKVDFAAGSNPFSVAISDFDGDGKPDLATTNYNANTVSVYRNTSTSGAITSASFAAKVDFTTGSLPYGLAVGDIDGDGKPDIVVTNNGSSSLSVLRNTASSGAINSGSFAAKVDFSTGNGPICVAIGDIDGNGKPDLVVTNFGANTVSVLRNTSTSGNITSSSFAAKVDFTLATGAHPYSVAIGDIDGDSKPDMVVVNQAIATISVFRNIATAGTITTGSFATKVDFATGTQPFSVALGDIDGDGKIDVVVTNNTASTVSVLRNRATSGSITTTSLASKIDFTTGTGPYNVAIGDMDGDGKADLVVANNTANTVSVLRNTAISGSITSASFASKADFITGSTPRFVAIGDLDGDGLPDFAVASLSSSIVSVSRNNPLTPIAGTSSICQGATAAFTDAAGGGTWTSSNPSIASVGSTTGIVRGLATGFATITYTLSGGRAIASVTINAAPTAGTITGSSSVSIGSGSITLANSITGGLWRSSNISIATVDAATGVVTGVSSGNAVISYMVTNSSLCSSVATKTLTVGPAPPPSGGVTNSTITLCKGGTVSLNEIIVGGVWSSNNGDVATVDPLNGIVTGTSAGRAMITYSFADSSGTSAYYTPIIVSSVADAVNITAYPGTHVEKGQLVKFAATLTGSGDGYIYQWFVNNIVVNGANTAEFMTNNLTNNDIVLCKVSASACAAYTTSNEVTVSIVGKSDNNVAFGGLDMSVVPNPNKGVFTVKGTLGSGTDEEVSIEIVDIIGQIVYRNIVIAERGKLNKQILLSHTIANGIYVLNVHTGTENRVFHIVVEQ